LLPTKSKDLLLSSPMQQQRRISVKDFVNLTGSQQSQTASKAANHPSKSAPESATWNLRPATHVG